MKPTLEQIKTDEGVWPDGATHCINGEFTKWVGGKEYCWELGVCEWSVEGTSWSLEKYEKTVDSVIIPRPTKTEWVPKVGEWCLSSGDAKVFYVGLDYKGKHVFTFEKGGFKRYETLKGFKVLKTKRKLTIEQAHKELEGLGLTAHLNILYDAGMLKLKESEK